MSAEPFAAGVNVTVERPPGTDRYGNPLPAPAPFTIDECAFAPRGDSDEDESDRRVQVITSLTMLVRGPADLQAEDVVIDPTPYAGRWQVEGDPAIWRDPDTGETVGVAAVLKHVEG